MKMDHNMKTTIDAIVESGVISIVRTKHTEDLLSVIKAIGKGGLPVIEVTSNTPGYLNIIKEVKSTMPEISIGAGTITTQKQAEEAIESGAQYLVTPITSKTIVEVAQHYKIPVVMGAFTPTEIHQSIQYGADFIKLFPAEFMSPSYLKAVSATCDKARFVPTGGISPSNMKDWFLAGAVAFGIGSSIVDQKMIEMKNFDGIERLAKTFKMEVQRCRGLM